MEETASLFTKADLAEREKRRMALAKAEIETSLAEKELQDWYRGRSKSSDVPKTPPPVSSRLQDLATSPIASDIRSSGFRPDISRETRPIPRSEVTSPGADFPAKTRPPSYPRLEIKARQPLLYPASEQSSESFISHRSEVDAKSFTVTPSARSDLLSGKEAERTARSREEELKREMERQRAEVMESIDRKIRTVGSGRQQETYRDFMERKGDVAVSQERESKGKIASEEGVSRYQYEGKITELEEQCSLKDKEIARLQHLLSSQKEAENTEIANLRAEVGRLTQDICSSHDEKQKLQDLLSTQSVELTALKVKLESKSRLATDYTSLAKELTEEKLRSQDSDLRRKWKQLEQDHLLLQRDYDTLAAMHKRALKDLKRVQSEESRISKSKPSDDMRRHYEGKMQGMEEETQYLKEKIRKLVSQYYHALEKLQRDNKQLKQDQARLSVETGEQLKGLERRVTELRRSRTRS